MAVGIVSAIEGIAEGVGGGWCLMLGEPPGVDSYWQNCYDGYGCDFDTIGLISGISVGIVWIVLGIVVMAAAKRHLTAVSVFGLIASIACLTVPNIQALVYYPDHFLTPTGWIGYMPELLFIPLALVLLAIAGRRGRPNAPQRVVAIVLLMLALGGRGFDYISGYAWWGTDLVFAAFVIAWIVLAATAGPHAQPTPPYPAYPVMMQQPQWQPAMVAPQPYYAPMPAQPAPAQPFTPGPPV